MARSRERHAQVFYFTHQPILPICQTLVFPYITEIIFFSSTGKTGPPRADGETFMAFWGQDARSARRAVQSLQLDEIRSVAHILLNKCLVPHLEWLSYQRDDVELTVRELPPTDVWPLLPRALQV